MVKRTFFLIYLCITLMPLLSYAIIDDSHPVRYTEIARAITTETAKKLRVQKDLYLVGTGGAMMDNIKMMAMEFDYFAEVDLMKARSLITESIEEYLSAINASKAIQPYLKNYPFTTDNIELAIFFLKPSGDYLPFGTIKCVDLIHGKIRYHMRKETNDNFREPFLEETYEEAVKILSETKVSIPDK